MKKSFTLKAAIVCGVVAAMLFVCRDARAQRTMLGQNFISVNYVHGLGSGLGAEAVGAEAYFGGYQGSFYWVGGLQFTPAFRSMPLMTVNLSGGAMYRLFGTRNRMFNGYVGGNALFGVETPGTSVSSSSGPTVNDDGTIDVSGGATSSSAYKTVIVYGFEPAAELEFFPFRTLAVTAGYAVPVKFQSQLGGYVFQRLYAGLRLNF